ncbi:MAG TPA: alanine--glyoxylate aminotransferase family protein [Pseudobdellovibrionaceae bacterium]|nr:alanine--glyoxylate aminotransferase family protein [Pseudobdellovibrionaceae bacterium]
MAHDESLLAPGPVNLHPQVRHLLGLPMIHHRAPEFDAIFLRALEGLKSVFATKERVYIQTSVGSGGMESLLVNTLSPHDKVIVVVSGKFGERWADMAKTFGLRVVTVTVPWGQAVAVEDVKKTLEAHPDAKAVFCQACETSTAVLHPIREIGALVGNHPGTLFLVDGITAVGAFPLPMDEWGIDGLVAGSQKAFMLPAGLSFVSFSKKAEPFIQAAKCPRYYFDIRRERKANEKGESAFSAAVPLVRALDWVLSDIKAKGLDEHYRSIERLARMTREYAKQAGLELYSKSPSPSVTALRMPEGIDGQEVRQRLETDHRITVIGGQDQAKGKIIRIGHMGYIRDEEMLRLFESLGRVFQSLKPSDWSDARVATLTAALRAWAETHP